MPVHDPKHQKRDYIREGPAVVSVPRGRYVGNMNPPIQVVRVKGHCSKSQQRRLRQLFAMSAELYNACLASPPMTCASHPGPILL